MPNRILALLFLIPGLYFVNNVLILTGFIFQVPYLFFFVQIIAIFFPILTIKYVYLVVFDQHKKIEKYLLSGSVILFFFILYITFHFYHLEQKEQFIYVDGLNQGNYPLDISLYTILFYIWQVVYYVHILIRVRAHGKKVHNALSSEDKSQLNYIKQFAYTFGSLTTLLVILYIILPIPLVDYFFLPMFVTICYFFILYQLFHHNALFNNYSYGQLEILNQEITRVNCEISDTVQSNDLNEKEEMIMLSLNEQLEEKKIFKDPNLTLSSLAEAMKFPPYIVSKQINKFYNKNFFDLINQKRIESILLNLQEMNEQKTIEGIALENGFNSRASFYRAFKKYTGKSPSDFVSKN